MMIESSGVAPRAVTAASLQTTSGLSKTSAPDLSADFGRLLDRAISSLAEQEKVSEQMNLRFLRGEEVDLSSMLIAAERVSLGLELTVQVRNKVIEAYQEIMRMQI